MREPTLKTVIPHKTDMVLIDLAAKASEVAEDWAATYDAIRKFAVGRTWRDVLDRFPAVKREWTYRKASRRAERVRCFYRDNAFRYRTAPGYDGAAERERFGKAKLAYVIARNTEPNETVKAERLADAKRFLAKHKQKEAA